MRDTSDTVVPAASAFPGELMIWLSASFPVGGFAYSQGVETGGCPHTAIREDCSINLAAIAEMRARLPDLELVLIESGGDNLAATFSPDLADLTIYVIDVAQGEEIPRKGGPGITRSDFLVINKTDLAPYVGADIEVMRRDAGRQRGERPFTFASLKHGQTTDQVVSFIRERGGLDVHDT